MMTGQQSSADPVARIKAEDLDDFRRWMSGKHVTRAIPAEWWRVRTAMTGERNRRRD